MLATLKRALLLFWALWLGLVTATNLGDALKALQVVDASWPFASGNYQAVATATARYGVPGWVNCFLFAGVIAWEALAAVLFARAWWDTRNADAKSSRRVSLAFLVSLLLWAAFMLADEVYMTYGPEAMHMRIFIAQLATLLAIHLLPEE